MKAVLKNNGKIVHRLTLPTEPKQIWMGGKENLFRFFRVLPDGKWEFLHVEE